MDLSFIEISVLAIYFVRLWAYVKQMSLTWLLHRHKNRNQLHLLDNRKYELTKIGLLKGYRENHEAADVLLNLIEQDGAGEWPPRVVYDSWPAALQPYKDIYSELAPTLSCANPMIGDELLIVRRETFRSDMRERLSKRINIAEVEDLLNGAEAGNWSRIRRDQLNGVYCAIAVLRHAYRYVAYKSWSYWECRPGELMVLQMGHDSCRQARPGREDYRLSQRTGRPVVAATATIRVYSRKRQQHRQRPAQL